MILSYVQWVITLIKSKLKNVRNVRKDSSVLFKVWKNLYLVHLVIIVIQKHFIIPIMFVLKVTSVLMEPHSMNCQLLNQNLQSDVKEVSFVKEEQETQLLCSLIKQALKLVNLDTFVQLDQRVLKESENVHQDFTVKIRLFQEFHVLQERFVIKEEMNFQGHVQLEHITCITVRKIAVFVQ